MSKLQIFTGNANPKLAHAIAVNLGLTISNADVSTFSDGEPRVEILENVRGRDVFIIQATSRPANDHLMELVVMADALRRASAGRITAVIPYFGYARQDRRVRSQRVAITARAVADIIATVGVDRILTVDIHAEQIQGFFHIPVDNVYATPIMLDYIQKQSYQNTMVVSPDIGGVARARALAKRIDCDLAIIDKRRPQANEAQVMHIIGDVKGRHCLIVDDIVDTAGTLCKAADALIAAGASEVTAFCTHAVLSGNAIQNLTQSKLGTLCVTDSIALSAEASNCSKIHVLSLSDMLSESIRRINNEESISIMFKEEADYL